MNSGNNTTVENYILERTPIVSVSSGVVCRTPVANVMADMLYLKNGSNGEWQNITEGYIGQLQKCFAGDTIPNVILISCNNINLTKKCAAILSMMKRSRNADDEYEYEYEDDDDADYGDEGHIRNLEYENGGPDCFAVDLSSNLQPVNGMPHNYVDYVSWATARLSVLFYNVTGDDDIELKLKALDMCDSGLMMIKIDEHSENSSWVLDIMRRKHAEIVKIEDLSDDYYVTFIDDLLDRIDCMLEENLSIPQLVKRAKIRMGEKFNEEMLCWFIEKAKERAVTRPLDEIYNCPVILRTDLEELGLDENSALEELNSMIGLESVKKMAEGWCALSVETLTNKKLRNFHRNLIMVGRPGVGKTTIARLMAKILAESGNSNGNFSECSRSDLIGKYLGHTAPKIAAKFNEARNGVLFVDEAGFFTKNRNDNFLDEALKEFVRYMEIYPDVTVIFAMYDSEVEDFLAKDEGLRSRISEIVPFNDYSLDELWCIEKKMLTDNGYKLSDESRPVFDEYMKSRMEDEDFGNARETRKLSEACIRAISVRHMNAKCKKDRCDMVISVSDMKIAVQRLGAGRKKAQVNYNPIGFVPSV